MKPGLQTTEEEVEVYNRFVGEGGEQGRRVLKKSTGEIRISAACYEDCTYSNT